MRFLKVLGHIILSIVLVAVAVAAVTFVASLVLPDFFSNPAQAGASPLFTAGLGGMSAALLVPQWARRVAIGRRWLAALVALLTLAVGIAVAMLLARLSPEFAQRFGFAVLSAVIISALVTMGLIAVPWPVPLAALWRGEVPLVRTYWVWSALVGGMVVNLLNGISVAVYYGTGSLFLSTVTTGFFFLLYGFFAVAIWRSAGYYKGRRVWRILARLGSIATFGWFGLAVVGLFADIGWVKAMLFDPRAFTRALTGITQHSR